MRHGRRKRFGMQRARQLFDGVHHARRRAIDGVAMMPDDFPRAAFRSRQPGCSRKRGKITPNATGSRIREHDVFGLLRTTSSRLTCGHSCCDSTTDCAPARRKRVGEKGFTRRRKSAGRSTRRKARAPAAPSSLRSRSSRRVRKDADERLCLVRRRRSRSPGLTDCNISSTVRAAVA